MERIKYLSWLVVASICLIAQPAQAAGPSFRLVGPVGVTRAGEILTVDVHVDSDGRVINAVDAQILFSPLYLQVLTVERQQTIWPLWPEEPSWDNQGGTVSLVTGRPHGLVAVDAPIATITFRVLAAGLTQVVLDQARSSVHLNDGQGTSLAVTAPPLDVGVADALVETIALEASTSPTPDVWSIANRLHIVWVAPTGISYSYQLAHDNQTFPDDTAEQPGGQVDYPNLTDGVYYWTVKSRADNGEWSRVSQYRFLLDQQPPQPFQLTLLSSAMTGQPPALSWVTTDATSGVRDTHLLIDGRDTGVVISPLRLRPQWSGKTLTIVVRDFAGNEQRVSWRMPGLPPWVWVGFAFGGAGLMAGVVMLWVGQRPRRRR